MPSSDTVTTSGTPLAVGDSSKGTAGSSHNMASPKSPNSELVPAEANAKPPSKSASQLTDANCSVNFVTLSALTADGSNASRIAALTMAA